MLEFYPMPTNLNNGGALYPHSHHSHHATSHHHQNHGTAARFFDNPNNASNNNNNNNNHTCSNINNNNNGNGSTMPALNSQGLGDNNSSNSLSGSLPPSQPQSHNSHQLLQMTTTSPAYASCPPTTAHTTHTSRNLASPMSFAVSVSAAASTPLIETEASLTPQTLPSTAGAGAGAGAGAAAAAATTPTATPQSNVSAATTGAGAVTAVAAAAAAAAAIAVAAASASASAAALSVTTTTASSTLSPSISGTLSPNMSSSANTINPCNVVMLSTALNSTHCSTSSTPAAASTLTSSDCNGRTEVGHIKCEKLFEICEGCGQKIHDRYLMNVGDTNWHEQCLACCYCGIQLHHTCYVRQTKLYCKLDYDRLFGIKCVACCHSILPHEMVMRPIPNFIFHLSCFVCYACRLPLQKGEQFMLRDGQLFCYRHDLEKEMYLAAAAAQHCGFVGLDDDELMRPRDGRRGPKRPRTILTSQQRKQFKASFDQSPKPCRKVREALAKDTGLSVRVVQVWFQNQRAKMKKIQRKAKNSGGGTTNSNGNGNGNGNGGGNGNGNGSGNARNMDDKDKDKDEKSVKQESVSGSESGYLGLDSAFASQPLNPNLPFSPDDYPANSNDSFCSSDLSLDGSNFDQLDDDADSLSLNNLELQSTGSSGNHHHHHHHNHHHNHNHHHSHNHHSNPHDMIANLNTSLINPIDKLYLMQNSYFNSEQ